MEDTHLHNQAATNETADSSPSKAPETKTEAEDKTSGPDMRLMPGGSRRAQAEIGMSAMERHEVPSQALRTGEARYGDSPGGGE